MNDPQTTGQNHEVVDWRQAIQAYLLEHPRARAIDIAAAVGCTEAVALSFLSEQIGASRRGFAEGAGRNQKHGKR